MKTPRFHTPLLSVSEASERLKNGGVVVIPTETVYGIAGVFNHIDAITKIFKVKNRPLFNPLIVHIAEKESLPLLSHSVPPLAEKLAERFWPGPLTLVLPKRDSVPDLVTAGMDTVAIRMPNHPVALEIIRATGPLAAPSANLFGKLSATRLLDLDGELGARTDGLVDGGPCQVGLESTVVQVIDDEVTVLRPGGISLEALRELVPQLKVSDEDDDEKENARRSPGRVKKHYSPRTPLFFEGHYRTRAGEKVGYLRFQSPPIASEPAYTLEILSLNGDLNEAARQLFQALKRLDDQKCDVIIAERFPEVGLGIAINDRLERAAAR